MTDHITHHDDCGCLSATYKARIATLEAALESRGQRIHHSHEFVQMLGPEDFSCTPPVAGCMACEMNALLAPAAEPQPGAITFANVPVHGEIELRANDAIREANATVLKLQDVIRRAREALEQGRDEPRASQALVVVSAIAILNGKDGDPR